MGKRYKLSEDVLAVEDIDGRRRAITLPAGEIVKVVADPETGDGMADVISNGRIVEMFADDFYLRGTELTD